MWEYTSVSELYHYGVKGMKGGIRNYQNYDGTLTEKGRKRYKYNTNTDPDLRQFSRERRRLTKEYKENAKKLETSDERRQKRKEVKTDVVKELVNRYGRQRTSDYLYTLGNKAVAKNFMLGAAIGLPLSVAVPFAFPVSAGIAAGTASYKNDKFTKAIQEAFHLPMPSMTATQFLRNPDKGSQEKIVLNLDEIKKRNVWTNNPYGYAPIADMKYDY